VGVKLKHRWSVSHNYLAGITARDWWRLLRENRFRIAPAYWHRGLFVTLISFLNSWFRRREERRFGELVRTTKIERSPLFVLGHWRSGTTHLHNLLAEDREQFAYANTYQVVNPHTFLSTEDEFSRRFAFLLPDTRPMDNMALSFDAPQEDEFAMLLDSFRSLYLGVSFPNRLQHYERYLTFRDVPQTEIDEWKTSFLKFTRKLTFKYGGKAIVFKSPPHTARVRLLLEMFPEAKFVFIHRHPYEVYRSMRHYFDTAAWYMYLQKPDLAALDRVIFDRYVAVHDALYEDVPRIPTGHYQEIRFDDLERDPMGQVERLYSALKLSGFEALRPRLEQYVNSLAGYRKNTFAELPPEVRDQVATHWRRYFDAWGYSP
jgi:omega-hydroxy-beta-dihydromenaquinone-9 sulfotransferase